MQRLTLIWLLGLTLIIVFLAVSFLQTRTAMNTAPPRGQYLETSLG